MIDRIENLIGQEICVLDVIVQDEKHKHRYADAKNKYYYFYNNVGIPGHNTEDIAEKIYEYKIYYPSLNNTFFIPKGSSIEYATRDDKPEYFL
jgi:hypothetical protein